MKYYNTIDGKLQHLRELSFLERQLYNILDPKDYYLALKDYLTKNVDLKNKTYLTLDEVKGVDNFTNDYFGERIPSFQKTVIRAYVMGRYLAEADGGANIINLERLSSIPKDILTVAKEHNLTYQQVRQLIAVSERAGVNITSTTAETIQKVKRALNESVISGGGTSEFSAKMRDMLEDAGELNRDWIRVSVTEANQSFNDGYLSTCKKGEYVIGVSMPDCCNFCFEHIHNMIFEVIAEPKTEGDWQTKLWAGKTNVGRSTAKRKKVNGGLIDREPHELSVPAIPAHPFCRCRVTKFYPNMMWLDEEGHTRLAAEDTKRHKEFLRKVFPDEE